MPLKDLVLKHDTRLHFTKNGCPSKIEIRDTTCVLIITQGLSRYYHGILLFKTLASHITLSYDVSHKVNH